MSPDDRLKPVAGSQRRSGSPRSRSSRWSLLACGLFEAGWLRTRVLEVEIEGLPPELDGLRIAHLSDFHLGVPSRGRVRDRARRGLGGRAAARPRLRHRRPRLAPARACRSSCGCSARSSGRSSCSATTTSPSPAIRSRGRRELDGLGDVGVLLRDEAVDRRACAAGASRSSASTRESYRARDGAAVGARRRRRRPPDPALPLPGHRAPASRRRLPPRPRRAPPRGSDRASRIPGGRVTLAHLRARVRRGRLPHEPAACCTSRRAPARRSCPFRFFARPEVTELVLRPAGSPDCNNPADGRPLAHLGGHPRELRGRCRARDRGRERPRRGHAPAAQRRQGDERRRRRRPRAPPGRRLGRRTRPRSGARCRSAWPSTSGAWRISRRPRSTWSSTTSARRRKAPSTDAVAGRRAHAGHARDRAVGLPRVRLVAVAGQQDGLEGALDRAGRGGVRGVGDDLPRRRRLGARLDAVRAGRALPAGGRPAGRPAVGRRGARHLRLPDGRRARQWVEKSLFLAAIGEARDQGAKALEAFAYRYPEGESTTGRFLVHRTVFPRDFLEDFGFTTVRSSGQGRALPARARRASRPSRRAGARRCSGSCRRRSSRPAPRCRPRRAEHPAVSGSAPCRRRRTCCPERAGTSSRSPWGGA